jgi:formylglycine-generating enzyme required for sulfatase activity
MQPTETLALRQHKCVLRGSDTVTPQFRQLGLLLIALECILMSCRPEFASDLADSTGTDVDVGQIDVCGLLGQACPDGFVCTQLEPVQRPNEFREFCYREIDNAVYVPAGPFWMGCNSSQWKDDVCDDENTPAVLVHTDDYLILRTQVTVEEYDRCLSDPHGGCDPCLPHRCVDNDPPWRAWMTAATTTLEGPARYCDWLARNSGTPWRLCSEAEWEKAARGGCETLPGGNDLSRCAPEVRLFPWGDALPNCDLVASTQICVLDLMPYQRPVGSRPAGAGPYGVLDMWGTQSPDLLADCYPPHERFWGSSGYPALDGAPWTSPCLLQTRTGSGDTELVRRRFRGGGDRYIEGDPNGRLSSRFASATSVPVIRCCADFD